MDVGDGECSPNVLEVLRAPDVLDSTKGTGKV